MTNLRYALLAVLAGVILTGILFAAPLLKAGERAITPLENIHGIPFPARDNAQVITEPLAHADIFLVEPTLAKNLALTITFHPGNLDRLGVGIRENDFWLSYTPTPLNHSTSAPPAGGWRTTQTITIPLTDKLQEKDRSLDLMFFAEAKSSEVQWELVSLTAATTPTMPTKAQLADYLRSIIKKERAL